MRVDFLITELNVGGAEKALTQLAIGMHRRNHDVRVLSIGSEPPIARRRLVDQLVDCKIEIRFGGYDHWSRLISASRWLSRQLCDDPPDVLQTFLFHANCLGTMAARHANVARVVGGLRVAETHRMRLVIERQAVRRMAHLVCVSEQVRRFAISRLSVNPQTCSVIPNGVDVTTYRDAAAVDWRQIGWPSESNVALFVGRLHRQKGIELLQNQFDELIGRHPQRRLLLIGDGPLRDSLSRWADGVGPDRVQILPWQNHVAPFIKAATMVMLPSHYEGMPNVILEAMAAGKPVICSLVHGSEELLGDESTERCRRQGFAPGDGAAMTRLADTLFEAPDLCRRLGTENQRHVETEFSIDSMIDRYEALYQSL